MCYKNLYRITFNLEPEFCPQIIKHLQIIFLDWYHYRYYNEHVSRIEDIVKRMEANPQQVRFSDLAKVCAHYFGAPRNKGTSHHVYKTPWPGDPRVNIQKGKGGTSKVYQVKQVLKAIEKKGMDHG